MDVDSDLKTDRFVREKPHNPDDIDVQYPDRIKTLLIQAAILFPETLVNSVAQIQSILRASNLRIKHIFKLGI